MCYEAICVRCGDERARPNRARPWHAHGKSVTNKVVFFVKIFNFESDELSFYSLYFEKIENLYGANSLIDISEI